MTPIQQLAAIETEKYILNLMLSNPNQIIPKVKVELVEDDFFRESHKPIFTALIDMFQANKPIDITTLPPWLEKLGLLNRIGGLKAIADIYRTPLSTSAINTYLEVVKDRARRRNVVKLMDVAIANATDLTKELDLQPYLTELAKMVSESHLKERRIGDIAYDFLKQINDRSEQYENDLCVMTGLPSLDRLIHGLRKQELIYLTSRPSMDKSALGLQIALNNAMRQGKNVMYVSLEMGERQIFGRAVANLTKINYDIILYYHDLVKCNKDFKAVCEAIEHLKKSGLHFLLHNVNTPQGIYNQAQYINMKQGLDLINENDSLNSNMKYIRGKLKQLARDLDLPVLVLAQLSNEIESTNDKRPDLRDLISLEQDADTVLMMYRESYYTHEEDEPDLLEVIVRRQHSNSLISAYMNFYKPYSLIQPVGVPL